MQEIGIYSQPIEHQLEKIADKINSVHVCLLDLPSLGTWEQLAESAKETAKNIGFIAGFLEEIRDKLNNR